MKDTLDTFRNVFDARGVTVDELNKIELELCQALKNHDWYYEYSDDHRVWSNGSRERSKIKGLMSKLPKQYAAELYNKYAPEQFKMEV